MQKTAQKRSVLNKLREMSNVSGIAAENFFNPQFQEVMNNLRAVDANVRSIATGKEIEGGYPDPSNTGNTSSLKDLLKSAKSNFNRREYMTAVAELGIFHKKFFDITQQLGNLNNKVNEVHHQFLFQDLDEDRKKQLHDLKNRFSSEQQVALVKEANIMDFFYNIGTKRGRALAFYEKRYPKEIGRLKKETSNLLAKSEGMLAQLLSSLKEMAAARATRNVDKYMSAASKVSRGYEGYDKLFKDYYNTNIKGFLEKIELVAPTKKVEESGLGESEVTSPNSTVIKVPGSEHASPSDPTMHPESGEFESVLPSSNVPIDLRNPTFPKPPRLPSNLGPPVPVALPPDTERSLPPMNMESNPPVGQTMMGVAPPANEPVEEPVPPTSPSGNTIPGGARNPSTYIAPPRVTLPVTSSHKDFMNSLESLSGEDPRILSAYIKKYAQSIQGTDPVVAIKLLQLSKSIKG